MGTTIAEWFGFVGVGEDNTVWKKPARTTRGIVLSILNGVDEKKVEGQGVGLKYRKHMGHSLLGYGVNTPSLTERIGSCTVAISRRNRSTLIESSHYDFLPSRLVHSTTRHPPHVFSWPGSSVIIGRYVSKVDGWITCETNG
jgi:hypothetical protein